jgi:hypothetical protein
MGEGSRVFHAAKAGEGVAVDPGLGVGSACLAYLGLGHLGHY